MPPGAGPDLSDEDEIGSSVDVAWEVPPASAPPEDDSYVDVAMSQAVLSTPVCVLPFCFLPSIDQTQEISSVLCSALPLHPVTEYVNSQYIMATCGRLQNLFLVDVRSQSMLLTGLIRLIPGPSQILKSICPVMKFALSATLCIFMSVNTSWTAGMLRAISFGVCKNALFGGLAIEVFSLVCSTVKCLMQLCKGGSKDRTAIHNMVQNIKGRFCRISCVLLGTALLPNNVFIVHLVSCVSSLLVSNVVDATANFTYIQLGNLYNHTAHISGLLRMTLVHRPRQIAESVGYIAPSAGRMLHKSLPFRAEYTENEGLEDWREVDVSIVPT